MQVLKSHTFKTLAVLLIAFFLSTRANAQSSEITHLRCEGVTKLSKVGFGGWPEQIEKAFFSVNVNSTTGAANISGLGLAAQMSENKPITFDINETSFVYEVRGKMGGAEYFTTAKIDRYTGLSQITEIIIGGEDKTQYIFNKVINAMCKRVTERAF